MLKLILILVVATTLGVLVNYDPGYILINYSGWAIEMPLWLALLGLLLLYQSTFIFNNILKSPMYFKGLLFDIFLPTAQHKISADAYYSYPHQDRNKVIPNLDPIFY